MVIETGPLRTVKPFRSVTLTLNEYCPIADGVQVNEGLFVVTHPDGNPEYEYDSAPLPPAANTAIVALCPKSKAFGEAVKAVIEGSA
jgi:hypothetical protein